MIHKNKVFIIAWLQGEECEKYSQLKEEWVDVNRLSDFDVYETIRIKPEADKVLSWGEGCWVIGGSWRVFVKNKPQPHEIKNAEILFGWEWEDKK
jgi:hypothetical protein